MKHVLKLLGYGCLFGLMLISIPAFSTSFLLGATFLALPLVFVMSKIAGVVVKSPLAIASLLFALGVFETWLGIVKAFPISWVVLACFVVVLVFVKATAIIIKHFQSAFARDSHGRVGFSDADLRKIHGVYSPMAERFFEGAKFDVKSARGASNKARRAYDLDEGSFEDSEDAFEGPNPIFSADDPNGDHFDKV